ncbi:hypothetical protein ACEPAF_6529 [Sanghuangporus sanghuang]
MPVFDELQAFSAPEDAPDWTFVLKPPTERYQWPQLCNRFNQENYEEEIIPSCPGKYFDDLFDKWNAVHQPAEEQPDLMVPKQPEGQLLKLSNPRDAAVRRLNDDAFLTYAVELETRALHRGQIDFSHEPTYKNVMGIYHSAIQICAYRRSLTIATLNRIMRWSHYHPISVDMMKYMNYLADQTAFYASHAMQFMVVLNMTKYYEGTMYQELIRARRSTGQANGLSIDDIPHHLVEGRIVNYDPQYLMKLNEREEEARERLQATRHLMMEDMMITIYQYPSEIYQPDNMLTITKQDEEFGSSDETDSDNSDEVSEPPPTPMNS